MGLISFFKLGDDYLVKEKVTWIFWFDLILFLAAIIVAFEMYGSKWSFLGAIVSIIAYLDAVAIRCGVELKRAITERRAS